jgi:branched-chain amino acid transport system permease protein
MNTELLLQRLFDGLSGGSVYALIALGLVIIYRGTGHLNFAQGEMALFSAYVVYQMGEWGLPIGISLIVGLAVGFAIGAVAEVALVRPVAKKSPFAVISCCPTPASAASSSSTRACSRTTLTTS